MAPDRRLQLLPRVTTTDRLERSREVQRLLDCGAIMVNEARTEYLALPPVGGGDVFVPRNRSTGQEDNRGGYGRRALHPQQRRGPAVSARGMRRSHVAGALNKDMP